MDLVAKNNLLSFNYREVSAQTKGCPSSMWQGKCGEYLHASQMDEPTIEARLSNMVHDLVDYRLLNTEDREDLEEYLR